MALTDQGRDRRRYRIEGDLTNLWELIQAAYEEDRCRTHEHTQRDQEPTDVKEGFHSPGSDGPFTPARRTH